MKVNDYYQAIANVGFPIVVTGYVLLRLEKKIEKLTEAITILTAKIERR